MKFNRFIPNLLKKKKIEMELSEEMYRLIAENASELIRVLNDSFEIEYLNEEAHKNILGYPKEDLYRKVGYFFVHPDEIQDIISLSKEVIRKGHATREGRYKHKNGDWLWFDIKATKFKDDVGNTKILTIAREITTKKEYEKYLKRENEKLKELEKIRKDFLDIATHELKIPLNSILGSIQLLDESYSHKLSTDLFKYVEIIRKGVIKLNNLVLNLLDISNLETNNIKLNLHTVNLNELIQDIVSELQQLLKKKQQQAVLDFPEVFKIKLDKQRFERVVINLLNNAIKYSPINSKIYLKLRKLDNLLEFSVIDNGVGISKEEKSKLFKRFSKLDVMRSDFNIEQEGTGLGLYITKKIVELHQGTIEVESEGRNKGASFRVIIPIK